MASVRNFVTLGSPYRGRSINEEVKEEFEEICKDKVSLLLEYSKGAFHLMAILKDFKFEHYSFLGKVPSNNDKKLLCPDFSNKQAFH